MPIKPFSIAASDEALRDLQQRLNNARWAGDFANDGWDYGVNGGYLRELVEYWRSGYDWRRHEREINAVPQFQTRIDGVPAHFSKH